MKKHEPLGLTGGSAVLGGSAAGLSAGIWMGRAEVLLSVSCSLLCSRLEGCFAPAFVVMWGRLKREEVMKNKCKGLKMRRERLKNYRAGRSRYRKGEEIRKVSGENRFTRMGTTDSNRSEMKAESTSRGK